MRSLFQNMTYKLQKLQIRKPLLRQCLCDCAVPWNFIMMCLIVNSYFWKTAVLNTWDFARLIHCYSFLSSEWVYHSISEMSLKNFFVSSCSWVLQNLDPLVLATFIYISYLKCSSNLTQNHASVSKIFHTQINKNTRLFFFLGFNKQKLISNTEMMIIFKMSHAIIERIIAVCIFLLCWDFDNLNDLWNSAL